MAGFTIILVPAQIQPETNDKTPTPPDNKGVGADLVATDGKTKDELRVFAYRVDGESIHHLANTLRMNNVSIAVDLRCDERKLEPTPLIPPLGFAGLKKEEEPFNPRILHWLAQKNNFHYVFLADMLCRQCPLPQSREPAVPPFMEPPDREGVDFLVELILSFQQRENICLLVGGELGQGCQKQMVRTLEAKGVRFTPLFPPLNPENGRLHPDRLPLPPTSGRSVCPTARKGGHNNGPPPAP